MRTRLDQTPIDSRGLLRRVRGRALAVSIVVAALLSSDAVAQNAAGAGTITGRVLNSENGTYVKNARVFIPGTNREVRTDDYGFYRLENVPAGQVELTITYGSFEPQKATVNVQAGQTAEENLSIGAAGAQKSDDGTIVLDAFKVTSQRETNARTIANEEQRNAPNLKVVVAADSFGDVTEGNIGEFMKYLPGITVNYVAADVRTVSVRGFPDNFTAVYVDGSRAASAASGSGIRTFELEQVSINNVSRIEVTKVPTPDLPADVLGGTVNMISKSAFERARSELHYRVYASANSEDVDPFRRTSGPGNDSSFKVLPGLDFDYTLPITKDFGIVLTGLSSNQFNEQHRSQLTWRFAGAGATPENPYLQSYQMQDGPKNSFRDSISLKADWRISPGQILSASYQANYYQSFFGNRNINWTIGSNQPAAWTPETVTGAVGGSPGTNFGTSFRDKLGAMQGGNIRYTLNRAGWEIDAGLNDSVSRSWYRDTNRGHFEGVNAVMQGVNSVNYAGIGGDRPDTLTSLNAAGAAINPYRLENYRITTVRSRPLDARDEFKGAQLNVRRRFGDYGVKVGGRWSEQERDIRRYQTDWTYVGADGKANTADDVATVFADQGYSGTPPGWSFPSVQWPSPYAAYDDFVKNPSHFTQTASQIAAAEKFRINNSQAITEDISAVYLMGDAKLLNNKLNIVGGVRYERTEDKGLGSLTEPNNVYQRNADGSFVLDTAGKKVRKAEAGAAGSIQEVALTMKERGYSTKQSYDGLYPSINVTYNITDELLLRGAFAQTFGRPDFGNILPLARINADTLPYDDGGGSPNPIPPQTIIVNNPNLEPWKANNYDLDLEYYMKDGGVISGGVFLKTLKNFFGTLNHTATADELSDIGIDPEFAGLTLQTLTNVGDARISGAEFNYSQPLGFVGGWGKAFTVFANGTALHLSGPNNADFSSFISKTANWGITYSKAPFVVMLKWNYRGRQRLTPQTAAAYGATNGFYDYYAPRINLDINAEYQFAKHASVFFNARNLFNVPQDDERYNGATPDYAKLYRREAFGVQLALGVKGTF